MNLRNRASKSFLWTGVEHIGAQGISFVISVIIARLLFPEDFGLIGMLVVFTAIANILVDCGMSHSIIRTQHADKLDYASVFRFNVAVALLLYALLFFTAPLIARFYETETLTVLLRWYALIVVANALGIVQKARLVRSLQFKRLLKLTLPSILMGGSTGIAMAYYGFGVWSLVGSGLV
ncbi:MAG: oligosaccharide flippase family protein, partial [Marinirhabdus sp.]